MCAGCGGSRPTEFVHPEADFLFYETVGIVPFSSLGRDRLGGQKVTNVFFNELLRTEFAEVKDTGQFQAAMRRIRGNTPPETPWSSADLAQLGEDTNVQGVFIGIVREYEMTSVRQDSYPLVSLEVRLLDAVTGRVVWSASHTRRGGPVTPIFGWGEIRTLGELTTKVCHELLETLPAK
jgi:hypothetical protein